MAGELQKTGGMNLETILNTVMKWPGVRIQRDLFLRKELKKDFSDEVIEKAIATNPAQAGIPKKTIHSISNAVINFETTKVSAISVAASLPGAIPVPGVSTGAAIGAAGADIASYFAHMLRIIQELAYLYGWSEFDFSDGGFNSETMNTVTVFIGVMFGVQGAVTTMSRIAELMSKQVVKNLTRFTLTRGTLYPIVKQMAAKIGVRVTKQVFADTVASAIPVAGAVLSGGLTLAMFKPCCYKLRKCLEGYKLCDPDYYTSMSSGTYVPKLVLYVDDQSKSKTRK